MKFIINEEQLNKVKEILSEGKRATIFHKAAVGTTNPEYFANDTYDENKKKINLKNYLRLPGNKLVPNKSIIFNVNNESFIFMAMKNDRIALYKAENSNELKQGLIDNLFIIP